MICLTEPNGRKVLLKLEHAGRMPYHSGETGGTHKHQALQHIIYYQSGQGRIFLNGRWNKILPGEFWIVDAGEEHAFSAAARDPHVYLEATFEVIPHSPLTSLIRKMSGVPQAWRNPFLPSADLREDLGGSLSALINETGHNRPLYSAFEELRLCELVLTMVRAHRETHGPNEAPMDNVSRDAHRLVESTRIFLRKHYRRPLAMEELAAYLKCSVSTVSHVFKKATRHTVGEELRSMRLARAKEMLRNSDYTIARISESCGFGDPAHFSRFFKRMEKQSPKDYRKSKIR